MELPVTLEAVAPGPSMRFTVPVFPSRRMSSPGCIGDLGKPKFSQ